MNQAPPLVPRLRPDLERLRGSGVVVAVSGGGDSVGLLRALHGVGPEYRLRLSVAHLDHGARGEESEGDARFVAELAGALGLPFDLGHWRADRAGHFEVDARRARYEWLAKVARGRQSAWVAVGQTLDDQAETIFHRVVRGTGLRGLAGMPARRRLAPGVTLIRPLLGVGRGEVRAYLGAIGQDFREDSSNLDTSRTRARIRLEWLPSLAEDFNPNVAEALVNLGRIASEANARLERVARERLAGVVLEIGPDRVSFDRSAWLALDPPGRVEVLRLAWRRAGWPERAMDARRWRRLASREEGRFSAGAGVEAEVTTDRLVLSRSSRIGIVPPPAPVELPVPGSTTWGDGRVVATLDSGQSVDESVDLDALDLPLMIRSAEPGDRFEPLGLGGKTQALNDFFRGRRVARGDRGAVPLVCDRSGIVWVVGHRVAHRVRRTEATVRVLGLRFEAGATTP